MKNPTLFILLVVALCSNACSQQDQRAEQHKVQLVKANDEMFNKGNIDFPDEVFADDYRGEGPELIKKLVAQMKAAFPDLQVKIDPLIAEGNMTAWRRTHTGTHQGAYWGFPPSGNKISWEDIIISRYENGKVAEEWGAGNLSEVLEKENSNARNADKVLAVAKGAVDALNNKDAKRYADYLHPGFTRFLAQSPDLLRVNNTEALEEDFQNGMQFNMQLDDLEVAFYGNTAIVTGYESGPARMTDGQVIDGKRKYSSVWIFEDGQWKEVHLHISTI